MELNNYICITKKGKMRIISYSKLRTFFEKDKKAEIPLKIWFKTVKKAEWDNFSDVKETFHTVDSVGNQRFIFNISGNHFRIVAQILFNAKRVYIRFVGNHKEYDKINKKDIDKI